MKITYTGHAGASVTTPQGIVRAGESIDVRDELAPSYLASGFTIAGEMAPEPAPAPVPEPTPAPKRAGRNTPPDDTPVTPV